MFCLTALSQKICFGENFSSIAEVISDHFSLPPSPQAPLSGSVEPLLVDLIPGGSTIPVTPDRIQEYVRSDLFY